jgi:hypothetical protein
MMINLQDLPKLFQSYIAESTQINRKNCPSPEILSECFQGQASKKNKNTVIEHITHCKFCLEEFQFILEIRREKKKLIQKVSHLLIGNSKNIKTKREKAYFPFLQKTWNWAFFTAGAVLVLATGLSLYVFINGGFEKNFRGTEIDYIKLIQPTHNKATKAPIVFHWKNMENAEYYILELFDNTLFPIWKSQKIPKNRALLPNAIMESLSPGKSYYWFITGFFPGNGKIESSLEQFQIKK